MAKDLGVTVNNEKPYIFISYNTEDYERVARIVQGISRQNINIWYDQGIQRVIMEEWQEQIAKNIRDCEFAMVFISSGVFQKENSCVKEEYELMTLHEKKVCVVLLDKIDALQLPTKYEFWWNKVINHQCINGYAMSENELVEELINECKKLDAFKANAIRHEDYFSRPGKVADNGKISDNYYRYQATKEEKKAYEEGREYSDLNDIQQEDDTERGYSEGYPGPDPSSEDSYDYIPEEKPSFFKKYWPEMTAAVILAIAVVVALVILKGNPDDGETAGTSSSSVEDTTDSGTSVAVVPTESATSMSVISEISTTSTSEVPGGSGTAAGAEAENPADVYEEEILQTIQNAKPGDTFTFGEIDTDGILDNGDESIDWIVLEKNADRTLITTAYAIECMHYAPELEPVTWEESSIREWLNGLFYEKCFDNTEKKFIQKTDVTAEKNPNYSTDAGNSTEDYVFLMSYSDVKKYFSSDDERRCTSTQHAKKNGVLVNNTYNGTTWWWLRTPGETASRASIVNSDGSVTGNGYVTGGGAVRPCMWVRNTEE